jgi:hypothetical protein
MIKTKSLTWSRYLLEQAIPSLCNLSASVVTDFRGFVHHRVAENTEVAKTKPESARQPLRPT